MCFPAATTNPLPVGTEVSLNISHNDATVRALGVVTHSQAKMGMGIRFTDVQLDQNEILDGWLAAMLRD